MKHSKYTNGLDMGQFKRVHDISHYNSNYYIGFDGDILHGSSDDDNTTEWWVIFNRRFYYLGESYTSNNEELKRYDAPQS